MRKRERERERERGGGGGGGVQCGMPDLGAGVLESSAVDAVHDIDRAIHALVGKRENGVAGHRATHVEPLHFQLVL